MSKYIISERQLFLLETNSTNKIVNKLLSSLIKRKYPYIIGIEFENRDYYTTLARVNIYVDLNKFYQITNTTPPSDYLEYPYLLDLLEEPGFYLMSFVDEKYKKSFVGDFNAGLEYHLTKIYETLPKHLIHTKFENIPDDYKMSQNVSKDFLKTWKSELEPVDLKIGKFIPKVNLVEFKTSK